MKKVLFACIMSAVMIAPAHAQVSPGPYIGGGLSIFDQPNQSGTQSALNFFGGYDFNQTWGVEAGIMAVPRFNANDGALALGSAHGHSTYIAAKATMQINDKWAVVTKLGLAHTRLKFDGVGGSPMATADQDNYNGIYAGIGLKYAVTEKFSLSLDVARNGRQHYRIQGAPKPESVSLNASYKF